MELTKDIIKNLKDLSTVVEKGAYFTKDTIGFASNDGGMVAYYDYGVDVEVPDLTDEDIEEKEQDGFAVYDLPNLLNILDLYETPKIDLFEKHLTIKDTNNKNTNKFRYTDKESIKTPKFDKTTCLSTVIGTPDATIKLSKEDLIRITKQASVLGAKEMVFEDKGLKVTDLENTSFNDYTFELESEDDIPKSVIHASKFSKIIPDDYTVEFDAKSVVFKNTDGNITYILICIAV